MKQTLFAIFILFISAFSFAQFQKKPLIKIDFLLNDFKSAELIKNVSPGSVFNQKEWATSKQMNAGIGVAYIKGLNNHIDIYGDINASFLSYTFENSNAPTNTILFESDAGLNIKLISDKYVIVPFLNTGTDFFFYKKYFGLLIPLGAGFQFNLNKGNIFLFTNAQYKFAITANAHAHFTYSSGIGFPLL